MEISSASARTEMSATGCNVGRGLPPAEPSASSVAATRAAATQGRALRPSGGLLGDASCSAVSLRSSSMNMSGTGTLWR